MHALSYDRHKQMAFSLILTKKNFIEKVAFDLRIKGGKDNGGRRLKKRHPEKR